MINVIILTRDESPPVYRATVVLDDSNFDLSTALFHVTMYRQFARKVGTSANSAQIRYYFTGGRVGGRDGGRKEGRKEGRDREEDGTVERGRMREREREREMMRSTMPTFKQPTHSHGVSSARRQSTCELRGNYGAAIKLRKLLFYIMQTSQLFLIYF